jgi:hypothetical protein
MLLYNYLETKSRIYFDLHYKSQIRQFTKECKFTNQVLKIYESSLKMKNFSFLLKKNNVSLVKTL